MPSDETAKPCTPVQFRAWPPPLSHEFPGKPATRGGENPMSDMRRREFITLLAGAAAAWPLAARAQQGERMRRVGILMPYRKEDAEIDVRVRAFRQELGKLGWTDGANVQFDERWPADDMDRVRSEAASLIASSPDAPSSPPAAASFPY